MSTDRPDSWYFEGLSDNPLSVIKLCIGRKDSDTFRVNYPGKEFSVLSARKWLVEQRAALQVELDRRQS